MKVVLAYDEPMAPGSSPQLPEDLGAEYESSRTIEALLLAIRACKHEALGLSFREDFPGEIRRLEPDLVFNIVEGIRGPARESLVPAWLDHLRVPYTGSDGLTLALSLDKALTKTLVRARGLRTPRFRTVSRLADLDGAELEFPLFVKPNSEGSSMGIRRGSRVTDPEQLEKQAEWVLETYREDCLVEEFAPGREFCVAILGNEEPRLLPIVEITSTHDFYPYEQKHEHLRELISPAKIPNSLAEEIRDMGIEAFRALGCRDLARVDLKLDREGKPTFLEINPLPGLSPYHGIFAHQAGAGGLSHAQLIGEIIDLAWERVHDQRERIAL